MAKFVKVYSLTKDCSQSVTLEQPVLPGFPYTIVEVIPNEEGTDISRINGTYVFGPEPDQYIQYTVNNPDIYGVMLGSGDTLLEKVRTAIGGFSNTDIDNILEAQPSAGMTQTERLISVYEAGVASTLFFYNLISRDLSDEGAPFDPFEVAIPADDQGDMRLNQNVYQYLNYSSKVLTAINMCSIGKSWLSQISDFWNVWGLSFPAGKDQNFSMAVFKAVSGFASYITVRINTATEKVDAFDTTQAQYMKAVNQSQTSALSLLNDQKKSLDTRFTQALLVLLTSAAPILDAIKKNGATILGQIEEARSNVANDVIGQFNSVIADYRNQASQIMNDASNLHMKAEYHIDKKGKDVLERVHKECSKFEFQSAEFTSLCDTQIDEVKTVVKNCTHDIKKIKKESIDNLNRVSGVQLTVLEQLCKEHQDTVVNNKTKVLEEMQRDLEAIKVKVVEDMEKQKDDMLGKVTDKAREAEEGLMKSIFESKGELMKNISEAKDDLLKGIYESKDELMKNVSTVREESCSALRVLKDDVLDSVYIGKNDLSKFVEDIGCELLNVVEHEVSSQIESRVADRVTEGFQRVESHISESVERHITSISSTEVKKMVEASTSQIEEEVNSKLQTAYSDLNSIKDETEKLASIVNKKYSRIKVVSDSIDLILKRLDALEDPSSDSIFERLSSLEKKTQRMDDLIGKLIDVINKKK